TPPAARSSPPCGTPCSPPGPRASAARSPACSASSTPRTRWALWACPRARAGSWPAASRSATPPGGGTWRPGAPPRRWPPATGGATTSASPCPSRCGRRAEARGGPRRSAAGPAVLAHQVGEVPAVVPARLLEHRPLVEAVDVAEAEDRERLGPLGHPQQAGQRLGVEQRHPAHAQALDPGGEPHVLDGAGGRGDVHLGQRAPAEHVAVAAVHQRHHQHLAAVEDALHLELEELGPPGPELVGGGPALGLDPVVAPGGAGRDR